MDGRGRLVSFSEAMRRWAIGRARSAAIAMAVLLWFGTTASVCVTPNPPACHVGGRRPAGFAVICDQCVAVSPSGGPCVSELCPSTNNPATAPRCDPSLALVCVAGTCQTGVPFGRACSTTDPCDEQGFCFHSPPPHLGESQVCVNATAAARDLAGLLGVPGPFAPDSCQPYQLTEGTPCDSDATAPEL